MTTTPASNAWRVRKDLPALAPNHKKLASTPPSNGKIYLVFGGFPSASQQQGRPRAGVLRGFEITNPVDRNQPASLAHSLAPAIKASDRALVALNRRGWRERYSCDRWPLQKKKARTDSNNFTPPQSVARTLRTATLEHGRLAATPRRVDRNHNNRPNESRSTAK